MKFLGCFGLLHLLYLSVALHFSLEVNGWKLLMQGMFTCLLGNLSLLSYFAKKREKEAIVVQTLGVISTYVVLAQLSMAEAMHLSYFVVTSIVVATGLVLNFMNYFSLLNAGIWRLWEDFITVGGLSVLPQVLSLSLCMYICMYICMYLLWLANTSIFC